MISYLCQTFFLGGGRGDGQTGREDGQEREGRTDTDTETEKGWMDEGGGVGRRGEGGG